MCIKSSSPEGKRDTYLSHYCLKRVSQIEGVSKFGIGTQMTQIKRMNADLFNYKSIKTICANPLNLRHLRAFPQFDTSTQGVCHESIDNEQLTMNN